MKSRTKQQLREKIRSIEADKRRAEKRAQQAEHRLIGAGVTIRELRIGIARARARKG